jgi:hypothetical protein
VVRLPRLPAAEHLNLPTTRDLMDRLRVDQALRQFCGWRTTLALPHESKFSRAFAEFATRQLPQQLHEAVIRLPRTSV